MLVQDPAAAKLDGMPRSAVDTGLADVVAPAAELPERLVAILRHRPRLGSPSLPLEPETQSALGEVFVLLRGRTLHDLLQKPFTMEGLEEAIGRPCRRPPTADPPPRPEGHGPRDGEMP